MPGAALRFCGYQHLHISREDLPSTTLPIAEESQQIAVCLDCTGKLFQDAAGKEEVRGSRRAEENWKNKNMPCVSIPQGVSSRSSRNIPRKAQLQRLRFSYDWNNSHLCVTCWQNCWLVFYHVFQDFRICLCQNPEVKHSEDIYCSACKKQFCLNWLLWFLLSLLFTSYFLICGVQPLWIRS